MNFRDRFYDNFRELGGFAENEDVIDGGYDEYVAFNYCLAQDYYNAMYMEDFEELGYIDNYLINEIMIWIDYDDEKNNHEEIEKIPTGMITTYKKRPFIEAVIENKHTDLARIFISNGNKDIRLFLTYMFFNPCNDDILDDYAAINWYVSSDKYSDRVCYITAMKRVFDEIEYYYNAIEDNNEKLKVLEIIRKNIQNIKFPREFGKINIDQFGNYNFVRKLVK